MSALSTRSGAPSGSLYHRFEGRGGLVAALWLRTVDRFETTWREAAQRGVHGVAEAAVGWCSTNPREALLLAAGPRFAGDVRWPDAQWTQHRERRAALRRDLHSWSQTLGWPEEKLRLALVELPMVAVKQHLGPSVLRAAEALLPAAVTLARLDSTAIDRFRRIRLRSLLTDPAVFGSDFDEVVQRPPESWARQLEDLPTFVAVHRGRDVGVVRTHPGDVHELLSMWVAPEVRGRGVGEQLVAAITTEAAVVELGVRPQNHAARRLYGRCGFVELQEVSGEVRMRWEAPAAP